MNPRTSDPIWELKNDRNSDFIRTPSYWLTRKAGVEAEIKGLAEARPGLAQTALAMARIMDSPQAVNQQPAAAKVLTSLLDKLRSASAQRSRGNPAVVKSMTTNSPSA